MVTAAQIQRHLRFLPVPDSHMIAYILRENANVDSWKNIVVIFNAKATSKEMELPEEDWSLWSTNTGQVLSCSIKLRAKE